MPVVSHYIDPKYRLSGTCPSVASEILLSECSGQVCGSHSLVEEEHGHIIEVIEYHSFRHDRSVWHPRQVLLPNIFHQFNLYAGSSGATL